MNQELGLKVLGMIMQWDDDRAREEFSWLRMMARLKYDGYRDFQAGMRFIESLVTWLQQFDASERETAYDFVRHRLVYIGPREMQKLVEQFYPVHIQDRLLRQVSMDASQPIYMALSDPAAVESMATLLRQTLFMGLSDGARLDLLRHLNAGRISNEQVVQTTQIDRDKWGDLLDSLRGDLGDDKARFKTVYLIDDFAGTGSSFVRWNEDKQKWSGKLRRFFDSLQIGSDSSLATEVFDPKWVICAHHYLVTSQGAETIRTLVQQSSDFFRAPGWADRVEISFGYELPAQFPIDRDRDRDFIQLTQKYYDPGLRTKHTDVGGVEHLGLGYGGCALPLVLDHNTPNNSVALLWAETDDVNHQHHAMRPLFRRRQRHS